MFDNDIQNINLIQNEQNIKLSYQIRKKNIIIKSEQSVFALDDNQLSLDTKVKLELLEKSEAKTFVTALCENIDQKIVTKDYVIDDTMTAVYYDTFHNIILNNSKILESKNYYNDGNIDYLLSAYTILHNAVSNKLNEKSLNILILNNKMYCIILDENKKLLTNGIFELSPYHQTDESSFYEDEITKQKLYEEVYLLELEENIKNITNQFYEKNNNEYFIENINIFYSIRQLNENQIQNLNDSLMINVQYIHIDLDNILYTLVEKPHIKKQNFISVRKQKNNKSFLFTIILFAIITSLTAIGVVYFKQNETNTQEIIVKKKTKQKENKTIDKIEEIALPNHSDINEQKIKFMMKLFDTISAGVMLKEVQIQNDESTLICSYLDKNSYEMNLKPKLLVLYKNTQNVLSSNKNNIYTAIISNTNIINKMNFNNTKLYTPSVDKKHLSKEEAKAYIQKIIQSKNIKFESTNRKKHIKYIFSVSKTVNSPVEFYDAIDKINKQYYSIILSYPIEFTKVKNTLQVNYNLAIYQNIKN
jgi:polyhydroxyalkanoate synthesis regulator phasin